MLPETGSEGPNLPPFPPATPVAADDQTVEIEQLLRRAETEPRTHTFARLGDLYRQAGEHERALGVIRDGLREHPYYLDARLLHARVLLELGRDELARIEFEHILMLDPANPLACMALGVERVEGSGSDGAASADDWLEALENAWRSDGADARPAPGGGATSAPRVSPQSIETSTLAGLYASQGLFDRAIGVYEQMLSRDPDSADVAVALAEMRRRADEAGEPPSGRAGAAKTRAPRDILPAGGGAESADPADAGESIGEQLRRILDGEAPANSD
ncbi:MAG: tetratricopeptide repeat protein [Gemmatimonadales bacterium]|nr:tetratricopeptide repeat protein [Gemmatimonadales bacterium]MXX79274.1 tetratricopeptide repeat protein [Gemmatimonadales bacterium]MYC89030.1 tetratricopeptide repeat protein [Candidatus Palauibacter denitrificans]